MFSSQVSSDCLEENSSFGQPKDVQEKLLRNSNIFKQQGEMGRSLCQKHPTKRAKYYVENDRQTLFCSKCALTLALLGMKIEETPSDEEILRKNKITAFTQNLSVVINKCEQRSKLLQDNTNIIKKVYEFQKDYCISLFDTIITKANLLKQEHLTRISTQFQNQMQEIQQLNLTLINTDQQLKQFLVDVEKNQENIVRRMEMQPFAEIMGKYDRRVDEHLKVIEELKIDQGLQEQYCQLNKEIIEQQITLFTQKQLQFKDEIKEPTEKGHIFQQKTDQCLSKLQNQVQASSNDMRFFEVFEGEEIYQSTCSNSLQRSNSIIRLTKPSQSPMRLPPFPKSTSQLMNHQHNFSRRESGHNTPDSCKWGKQEKNLLATPVEDPNQPIENTTVKQPQSANSQNEIISRKDSPNKSEHYQSETNKNRLDNLALQLKMGGILQIKIQIKQQEKIKHTPKHVKQQSYQPVCNNPTNQTSLNGSLTKNMNIHNSSPKIIPAQYYQNLKEETPIQQMWSQSSHLYHEQHSSQPLQQKKQFLENNICNNKHQTLKDNTNNQQNGNGLIIQKKIQATNKRSLSKGVNSNSTDICKSEGKKQFIIPQDQGGCGESLKDRIFKELSGGSTGTGDSVYNQVLKINQKKLQSRFIKEKENFLQSEWSSSSSSLKKNSYLCSLNNKR